MRRALWIVLGTAMLFVCSFPTSINAQALPPALRFEYVTFTGDGAWDLDTRGGYSWRDLENDFLARGMFPLGELVEQGQFSGAQVKLVALMRNSEGGTVSAQLSLELPSEELVVLTEITALGPDWTEVQSDWVPVPLIEPGSLVHFVTLGRSTGGTGSIHGATIVLRLNRVRP